MLVLWGSVNKHKWVYYTWKKANGNIGQPWRIKEVCEFLKAFQMK